MENSKNLIQLDFFPKNIKAAISTRHGGYSTGKYESFNLATHVDDNLSDVLKNRALLQDYVGDKKLVWMNQTHSNVVEFLNTDDRLLVQADGIISNNPNLCLCVMTADCVPMLLCSKDGEYFGAIHCGWRGVVDGIVCNAINLIKQHTTSDICIYLGPSIQKESFEVGPEVFELFSKNYSFAQECFIKLNNDKFLCDLFKIICKICNNLGVFNLNYSLIDTFKQTDSFYSYRKEGITGRQVSIICKNTFNF